MSDKKFNILIVVSAVILQVATIGNVYGLELSHSPQFVMNLIAIALELLYFAVRFKKNGNLFFRGFMAFLGIKEALALINMALYETVPASAIAMVLACYTCAIILAVSKDLGKTTSYILGFIILAIAAACLAYSTMLMAPSYMGGSAEGDYLFVYNGTRLMLSCELLIMITAKYKDKKERNTK